MQGKAVAQAYEGYSDMPTVSPMRAHGYREPVSGAVSGIVACPAPEGMLAAASQSIREE